jgi:hypothetical protein
MKKMIMLLAAIMMVVSFSGVALADSTANANADASANTGPIVNNLTQGQSNDVNVNIEGDEAPVQKDLTTTRVDAKGYRGFAVPHDLPIVPQGPAYFGTTTPGPQFQSMKTAIIYKDVFGPEELERMAKGCDVEITSNPLIEAPDKENLAAQVKVFLSKPAVGAELVGYITVKTDDSDDVSMDALAAACLEARKMGGNAVHITAEGVKRLLESFGWGIGLAHTTATMSASEQTGTVNSGGFGISGGHAGYVDYPWLQLFVLKVK